MVYRHHTVLVDFMKVVNGTELEQCVISSLIQLIHIVPALVYRGMSIGIVLKTTL